MLSKINAVENQRWSRFSIIFSVDMWICFALSLALAVITVSCISINRHKSHLHQSQSYSNICSVIDNITAVSLSVSVNTQPRCAPLRLFFFCWVCYSVAISTVFQAHITFLIEPGYEEPTNNVEYVLALACFVNKVMWKLYRSEFCEPINTFLSHE